MIKFVARFPGQSGLTLNAQLYDAADVAYGAVITTGFGVLLAQPDTYTLLLAVPAGHIGTLIVYDADDPLNCVPFSINPTELESSAADNWTYGQRTLTNVSPGSSLVPTIAGGALSLIKAVSFDAGITGLLIPINWAKIYFTMKVNATLPDSQSTIQIVVSNPADVGDGLLYLNGASSGALSQGTLTIDQPGGNAAISVSDDKTSLLDPNNYVYDLKVITSASKSAVLAYGPASVGVTPTLTV